MRVSVCVGGSTEVVVVVVGGCDGVCTDAEDDCEGADGWADVEGADVIDEEVVEEVIFEVGGFVRADRN